MPAQYAFVVHTANPISKQKGETFGEVVMGMGEALVGNYPGRALSFSAAPGQQVRGGHHAAPGVNYNLLFDMTNDGSSLERDIVS